MSRRLKLLLGSTLTLVAVGLSLHLSKPVASLLLGGVGGLLTGALASHSQTQQSRRLQQQQQTTEQMLAQTKAGLEEQLAVLQSQIANLTGELEDLRNRQNQRDFSLAPFSLKPHARGKLPKAKVIVPYAAIDRLAVMGIKVENYAKPKGAVDPIFDRLALFLGDYYAVLACLYAELKRAMHTKTRLRFNLKGKCPEEIARSTQLMTLLREASLAYDYHYSKERKFLQAGLHEREDIRRFFNGEWFERYVCQKLNQFFQAQGWQHQYLKNAQIQFSTGDRAELDLFWLVEGQPLWIECKTGRDYDSYLKRYSQHRRRLGIASARAILMVLDISPEEVEERSGLWELTIGTRENLIDLVCVAVGADQSEEFAGAEFGGAEETAALEMEESMPYSSNFS
jgi:Domain of unknown function (DUF1887)